MKRVIRTEKQYDYHTLEEMQQHIDEMEALGWWFKEEGSGKIGGTKSSDKWQYTAIFYRGICC